MPSKSESWANITVKIAQNGKIAKCGHTGGKNIQGYQPQRLATTTFIRNV